MNNQLWIVITYYTISVKIISNQVYSYDVLVLTNSIDYDYIIRSIVTIVIISKRKIELNG